MLYRRMDWIASMEAGRIYGTSDWCIWMIMWQIVFNTYWNVVWTSLRVNISMYHIVELQWYTTITNADEMEWNGMEWKGRGDQILAVESRVFRLSHHAREDKSKQQFLTVVIVASLVEHDSQLYWFNMSTTRKPNPIRNYTDAEHMLLKLFS